LKKSLSPFRGCWGQEVIFVVAEANFWILSSFYKFSFIIFVLLGCEVVWPWQPQRPQKGLRDFFQKLNFWNQCIPRKKIRHVSAFSSKLSLNLSTEKVWVQCNIFQHFTMLLRAVNCTNRKDAIHEWMNVRSQKNKLGRGNVVHVQCSKHIFTRRRVKSFISLEEHNLTYAFVKWSARLSVVFYI
jgi:hypothetical protein